MPSLLEDSVKAKNHKHNTGNRSKCLAGIYIIAKIHYAAYRSHSCRVWHFFCFTFFFCQVFFRSPFGEHCKTPFNLTNSKMQAGFLCYLFQVPDFSLKARMGAAKLLLNPQAGNRTHVQGDNASSGALYSISAQLFGVTTPHPFHKKMKKFCFKNQP